MIVYRVLSVFVRVFCALLTVITFFGIIYALANPAALLQCFLFAGTVLYGWFANRFNKEVLLKRQKMSKRHKDWLQVNALVALAFAMLGVSNAVYVYRKPEIFDEMLKQLPPEMNASRQMLLNISLGLFTCCLILLVHIIWTYSLIKKNKEYFEG